MPLAVSHGLGYHAAIFTNGAHIIGLLSTPKYMTCHAPANNLFNGGYSNHIVAYVRSISGPAVEKPPQDNAILTGDSFSYRIVCENAPVRVHRPRMLPCLRFRQSPRNLHELRLTFLWPMLPNGQLPARPGRQTFRALVAGQIDDHVIINGDDLFFPAAIIHQRAMKTDFEFRMSDVGMPEGRKPFRSSIRIRTPIRNRSLSRSSR